MSRFKRKASDSFQGQVLSTVKKQRITKKPALSQELVIESNSEEGEEEEGDGFRERERGEDEEIEDVRFGNGISNSKVVPTKRATPSKMTPNPRSVRPSSNIKISKSDLLLKKQRYESAIASSTSSEGSEDELENGCQSDNESGEAQSSNSAATANSDHSESGSESDSVVARDEDGQAQESVLLSPEVNKRPVEYIPPSGFEAAAITSSPSILEDLISSSNFDGKELWHIVVPAELPVDSIKEVPLQNVANGQSVLEHDGVHFGLQLKDTDQGSRLLLLPSATHNQYRSTGVGIVKTLRLQQLVDPALISSRQDVSIDSATAPPKVYKKSIRQQPRGLKMRYRPFGDESSSESSHERPKFKIPLTSGVDGPSPDRNGVISSDYQSPKRHTSTKKRRKEDTEPSLNALNNISTQPSPFNPLLPKNEAFLPLTSELGSNILDAKAARRAEKKRRKEARASGSLEPSEASRIRKRTKDLEKDSQSPFELPMPSTSISDLIIQLANTNPNGDEAQANGIVGLSNEKAIGTAKSNKESNKKKRKKTEVAD